MTESYNILKNPEYEKLYASWESYMKLKIRSYSLSITSLLSSPIIVAMELNEDLPYQSGLGTGILLAATGLFAVIGKLASKKQNQLDQELTDWIGEHEKKINSEPASKSWE
jgi:hypothetical protein